MHGILRLVLAAGLGISQAVAVAPAGRAGEAVSQGPVAPASRPPAKSHLVYVALQGADGALSQETQVGCDLAGGCEIKVRIRHPDLDTMMVRVFAEDRGGFSVLPIGADKDGNLAVGRRRDFGWGPGRSAMALVPAKPLKAVDDDYVAVFGLVMREDRPAVAELLVAVKELFPVPLDTTQ